MRKKKKKKKWPGHRPSRRWTHSHHARDGAQGLVSLPHSLLLSIFGRRVGALLRYVTMRMAMWVTWVDLVVFVFVCMFVCPATILITRAPTVSPANPFFFTVTMRGMVRHEHGIFLYRHCFEPSGALPQRAVAVLPLSPPFSPRDGLTSRLPCPTHL